MDVKELKLEIEELEARIAPGVCGHGHGSNGSNGSHGSKGSNGSHGSHGSK
jgi:hypothetical protein